MSNVFSKFRKNEHFSLYITFIVVFLLMSVFNGSKFFSWNNITSMMYQMPMIGLLSIGMLIAELTGGINLSLVSTANFNSIMIYVVLSKMTPGKVAESGGGAVAASLLISLALCLLVGFINGSLIAFLKVPALLVTLGTTTLLQGVCLVVTKGYTVSGYPESITYLGSGNLLGIPMSLIIFVIVVIATYFVLERTVYGKKLYMTGANSTAARYSNVNVKQVLIIQYMLSAMFSYFASLIMIGQMNSAKANYYESYLLIAVLASFLGGVNPNGGFGKLMGTVLAAIILQLISTGLNLMRMDPFMVTAMWGAIIILVLFGRELMGKLKVLVTRKKADKAG